MPICQLVYSSEAVYVRGGEPPIDAILRVSRWYNEQNGITGALMFDGYYYLQLLEGERLAVSHLFLKIGRDRRHRNIGLLSVRDAEARQCARWAMGYVRQSTLLSAAVLSVSGQQEFVPHRLTADGAYRLLTHCAEANAVESIVA